MAKEYDNSDYVGYWLPLDGTYKSMMEHYFGKREIIPQPDGFGKRICTIPEWCTLKAFKRLLNSKIQSTEDISTGGEYQNQITLRHFTFDGKWFVIECTMSPDDSCSVKVAQLLSGCNQYG